MKLWGESRCRYPSALVVLCYKLARRQQGHRNKLLAGVRVSLMRMLAIEACTCPSGRIWISLGSPIRGWATPPAQPGPPRPCGSRQAWSPPSRAPRRSVRSLAALQRADDRRHHRRLRIVPDPDARPVDVQLDDRRSRRGRFALSRGRGPHRGARRFGNRRHERRRVGFVPCFAPRLATPREQLLRRQARTPSSKLSATIAAFSCAVQLRRRPAPVKISTRRAGALHPRHVLML
jgi:hypothetical protein